MGVRGPFQRVTEILCVDNGGVLEGIKWLWPFWWSACVVARTCSKSVVCALVKLTLVHVLTI